MKSALLASLLGFVSGSLFAADWTRFRGPDGAGVSRDASTPVTWSETKNLRWKTPLPGPGSSSPIVLGNRVFVTCYSGYGVARGEGELADLKRHLICVNRKEGRIVWKKSQAAETPEDSYRGFISEHGYASSTPVTDGERVYVFYGKSGALAYDLEGKQLWHVGLGKESSSRRWGSAASPILYKDLLIVNAAEESQSIRGLDKKTGKEIWKAEASGLELSYSTPALVKVNDDRTDLVLSVPGEVWGLDPARGKLLWYVETELTGNVSPSVFADGDVAYVFGGYRGSGSMAIRAGGKGNVTKTHVVWSSRYSSYVPTPLLHEGRIHWVDDRAIAHCLEARTGKLVYRQRLSGGSGQGFFSRPFYSSMVLAGERLYAVGRTTGTFVFEAAGEFKQLARNRFESDKSDFNATPAIAGDEMFLRSNRFLYCIAAEK